MRVYPVAVFQSQAIDEYWVEALESGIKTEVWIILAIGSVFRSQEIGNEDQKANQKHVV